MEEFFKPIKSKNVLVFILLGGLILLSSCGNPGTNGTSTLKEAQEKGYVTIGFANEKPYAYQDADGKVTGEAVEIARAILKNLGIDEVHGELTEFGSLIPGLQAKRFDMITAGMYITPERAGEVHFANPEVFVGAAIGVRRGNPLNLHRYEDIVDHETATVAIPSGALEYDYLIDLGMDEDRIVTVPDISSALSALQAERVDAITATGPSIQSAIETADDPELERVLDFEQSEIDGELTGGYGASAFRYEDEDFVKAFNDELTKLKESGELLEIIKEFGFTKEDIPLGISLKDVLE